MYIGQWLIAYNTTEHKLTFDDSFDLSTDAIRLLDVINIWMRNKFNHTIYILIKISGRNPMNHHQMEFPSPLLKMSCSIHFFQKTDSELTLEK